MNALKLVAIGGDGIGPEVVSQSLRVLEKLETIFDLDFEIIPLEGGGKYYLDHGKEWADGSFEICQEADAILLGAVGYPGARLPDDNIAGAGIVLGLRFGLDLFANIRPTRLYRGVQHKISNEFKSVWNPNNVNFTIIRENTEGLYAPIRGRLNRGNLKELAIDTRIITLRGTKRVIKFAFDYCMNLNKGSPLDNKKRVTVIHKNNLLAGCQFFTEKFYEIALDYPEIIADDILVDAFTQSIIRNPENYNVCVTTNFMGDICTDLASVLQGGMGMAPSGQINGWTKQGSHGLFEPVHGSAPKYANKNIANPIATILAASMMLNWLGVRFNDRYREAGRAIEDAVEEIVSKGKILPLDLGGNASTSQVCDAILIALDKSK